MHRQQIHQYHHVFQCLATHSSANCQQWLDASVPLPRLFCAALPAQTSPYSPLRPCRTIPVAGSLAVPQKQERSFSLRSQLHTNTFQCSGRILSQVCPRRRMCVTFAQKTASCQVREKYCFFLSLPTLHPQQPVERLSQERCFPTLHLPSDVPVQKQSGVEWH